MEALYIVETTKREHAGSSQEGLGESRVTEPTQKALLMAHRSGRYAEGVGRAGSSQLGNREGDRDYLVALSRVARSGSRTTRRFGAMSSRAVQHQGRARDRLRAA